MTFTGVAVVDRSSVRRSCPLCAGDLQDRVPPCACGGVQRTFCSLSRPFQWRLTSAGPTRAPPLPPSSF